jgi:hypothetical protein
MVLQTPSDERIRLSARGINHTAPLRESGFYELRLQSASPGSGRPIAVNVDGAESDLSILDPEELLAATSAPAPGQVAKGGESLAAPEERERRQSLWWYLLLGALFLLAVETVMSNRLSRSVAPA